MVYIIRIYYKMNNQKTIGKRGIKVKDVQYLHNGFGKAVFIVTKEGFQSTILDFDEIQDLQLIKRQQKEMQRVNSELRFNIVTKTPTNLTKMEKKREEKQQKMIQKGPQTQISKDVVPSEIYYETRQECFNCIDKNEEIYRLKERKQDLKSQHKEKIQQKQKEILELTQKLAESNNENKRLRQNSKIHELNRTEIQQKCQKLQQDLNGCRTIIIRFQDERNALKDRNKHLSQSLPLKPDRRQEGVLNPVRYVSTLDIVDKMIQQHELVLLRMSSLERQNSELKIDNEAKKSRIQELLESRISQANSQAHNPEGQPDHPPLQKPNYIPAQSFSSISIPSENRGSTILDSLIMPPEE